LASYVPKRIWVTIHIKGAMNLIPTGAGRLRSIQRLPSSWLANAFGIVRKVAAAMDEAGVPQSEVDTFMQAAMAHDYDHLCGQS
jgi:hypothetical protein